MKISGHGFRFLIRHEGSRSTMYHDAAGLPTIGVGHLLTKSELTSGKIMIAGATVRWRDGLTDYQIRDLLRQDLKEFERAVSDAVKVPLDQHQFDALVSFAFNVGETAFRHSSLLRRLNNGDYDAVPDQLGRWVYAGGRMITGLVNRRRAEAGLFRGGIYG